MEKRKRVRPGERQQHRSVRRQRQQRRVALDVEVLLAAEGTAGGDLRDQHVLLLPAQERGDLPPVLPRTLTLREHVHARAVAGLRHGQRGLGLEVRVLDAGGLEAVRDDVGGGGQGGLHVTSGVGRFGEHVAFGRDAWRAIGHGLEGVGQGLEHLVLDLDELGRGTGLGARLGRHRREHIAHVARGLAHRHQLPPVVLDEALVALAGHVGRGDDRDHARRRLGRGGVDGPDHRARVVAEAQRAVEHARHDVVGHVLLHAQHLLARAVLGCGVADRGARVRHRPRTAVACGRDLTDGVDDRQVAGAAAEVAREGLGDGVALGLGLLAQQRLGLHHDARGAVAALRGAGGAEGVGPQIARLLGQALERLDRPCPRSARPAGRRTPPAGRRR